MESINGLKLKSLLLFSLKNLKKNEKILNDLNVFPVPDGDTGTNMRLTLEYGLLHANDEKFIGDYAKNLSLQMLIGARGNSGVILSQIFRGISKGLKNLPEASVYDFINSLILGYQTAYKAVKNPVEGSILTVCRVGIENVKNQKFDTLEDFFKTLCKSMKEVLDDTPNMLPILKEANVIDSGGAGLYSIFEGMLAYFGEDNFITLDSKNKKKLKYKKATEHKLISYIVVSNGDGIKSLFEELGADFIIEADRSMNVATNDFIETINSTNSDYIIMLPNNKNNFLACRQAVEITKAKNVYILDSESLISGYFALSMIDLTSDNFELQLSNAKKGISNVDSIEITKAIKNNQINGIDFKKGEYIAFCNNNPLSSKESILDALKEGIDRIDLEDKEIMAVFYGSELSDELKEEINSFIYDNYGDLEIGEVEGNQDNFELIIGIS